MTENTRKRNAKEELAERTRRVIEENYKEKFSLEVISGKLFANGSYILRTFKEVTGYTPLEYHNYVRCENAKLLLQNPNINISFISDEVGFTTQAHCARVFKKIFMCTPTEYRKRYIEEQCAEKKE